MRNESLAEVTKLIAYLDLAGEHGDASEANALYGALAITLDEWFGMPRDSQSGWSHYGRYGKLDAPNYATIKFRDVVSKVTMTEIYEDTRPQGSPCIPQLRHV